MNLIRKNIDFEDMIDLIGPGLVIGLVLVLVLGLIGAMAWVDNSSHKKIQHNLYSALKGESVENESAIEVANFLTNVYHNQNSESDLLNEIKEISTNRSSYFNAAMKHYEDVKEILDQGPQSADININVPTWSSFFKSFFLISWILLAICMSISYTTESSSNVRITYPWNKLWSLPAIIFLFPYLIISQSILLICYVIYKLRGDSKEVVIKSKNLEKKINKQKAKLKSSIIDAKKKEYQSLQNWINICGRNLIQERDRIKNDIKHARENISKLGQLIQSYQREIARYQAKLQNVEKLIVNKGSEKEKEFEIQFNKLLQIPKVKAVEVSDKEIKIYTDTIYMEYYRKCYEIGSFLIRIRAKEDDGLMIQNLCNTVSYESSMQHPYVGASGYLSCLGGLNEDINHLIKRREYFPLIISILQILQSTEENGSHNITLWKEAKK